MQEGVEELVERGHDELGALYGCPAWVGSAYAQVHEGRQGDARRNGPAGEEGAVDEEAVEAQVVYMEEVLREHVDGVKVRLL